MRNGKYLQREVLNLARFIAVQKFRPLTWRQAHPFLLADRFEARGPGLGPSVLCRCAAVRLPRQLCRCAAVRVLRQRPRHGARLQPPVL